MMRSRGPESTRSSMEHVREIMLKWPRSKGSPIATWLQWERPISIEQANQNDISMAHLVTRGGSQSVISSSDARSWATIRSSSNGGLRKTKNYDRRAIVALSSRDRGSFIAKSGATISPNDGPRLSCDCGHQITLSTGSNGSKLWRKFSSKNPCTPSFLLNSRLICEAIKGIWSKILSSSWSPRV